MKRILVFFISVLIICFFYSFFHISGREIKNVKELADAKIVTLTVSNELTGESVEYDLDREQIELLQNLLKYNSYKRRISNTIIGVLPDKTYRVFANWNDGGQNHLQICILGGEYIQFLGQYGSHYHKIGNADFERELNSILEME